MTEEERRVHEALRTVQQFMQWVGVCGCGDPVEVFMVPLKTALSWYDPTLGLYLPGPDHSDLWLYLLDAWNLADHGGSVYGSWLTTGGVRLRNALALVDLATYKDATGEGGPETWWRREQELVPARTVLTYGVWEPDESTPARCDRAES